MGLLTYRDVIQHGLDFLGGDPQDRAIRDVKRALQFAYSEVPTLHNWAYFYKTGRLNIHAFYDDGTITGDVTGGAQENMVTLTGGTWPTWAEAASLRVGFVIYRVAKRISDTVLTLEPPLAPVSDIAAGSSYVLYQDTYELPSDFGASDQASFEMNWGGMQYSHVRDWLQMNRNVNQTGPSRWYTITGDEKYVNRYVMRVWPYPDQSRTIDFIYRRLPLPMGQHDQVKAGTVSVTADSATLTGSGTAFDSTMIGCVIRVSPNSRALPTSVIGTNPYAFEARVRSVESATSLTLDDASTVTLSGVQYELSDLCDIETGVMSSVFLACVELQLARARNMTKELPTVEAVYQRQLGLARNQNSVSFMGRVVGQSGPFYQRLAKMPLDLNR